MTHIEKCAVLKAHFFISPSNVTGYNRKTIANVSLGGIITAGGDFR